MKLFSAVLLSLLSLQASTAQAADALPSPLLAGDRHFRTP
jgi:hypothetical protein